MAGEDRERGRQLNRWNNRVSYAAVLGRLRRERGLTREALAARAGIAIDRLKELEEADVDRLTPAETDALAAALGTTWATIATEARGLARDMREDR